MIINLSEKERYNKEPRYPMECKQCVYIGRFFLNREIIPFLDSSDKPVYIADVFKACNEENHYKIRYMNDNGVIRSFQRHRMNLSIYFSEYAVAKILSRPR